MAKKIIIGRSDIADFPELDLFNVKVKVDTGAYTSSIHCSRIEEIQHNGAPAIRVWWYDEPGMESKGHLFTEFRQKSIVSSTGNAELRYLIRSVIRLFDKEYPLELSLARRSERRFPILLGRKLLKGKFIVDPSKYNLSRQQKKTELEIK